MLTGPPPKFHGTRDNLAEIAAALSKLAETGENGL